MIHSACGLPCHAIGAMHAPFMSGCMAYAVDLAKPVLCECVSGAYAAVWRVSVGARWCTCWTCTCSGHVVCLWCGCVAMQVVYLLDMVRALEGEMRARLEGSGLDAHGMRVVLLTRLLPDAPHHTGCHLPVEKVRRRRCPVL